MTWNEVYRVGVVAHTDKEAVAEVKAQLAEVARLHGRPPLGIRTGLDYTVSIKEESDGSI